MMCRGWIGEKAGPPGKNRRQGEKKVIVRGTHFQRPTGEGEEPFHHEKKENRGLQ